MDRLKIRLTAHQQSELGRWTAVELRVNGRDLKDLVADYERKLGYEPFGGYASISLDGLQGALDRLTGTPNSWPGDGQTVLLVCEGCREEGCWPIFARVRLGEETVEWSDFEQPHRPARDYSNLRFTFDRRQYDEEIARAFGRR